MGLADRVLGPDLNCSESRGYPRALISTHPALRDFDQPMDCSGRTENELRLRRRLPVRSTPRSGPALALRPTFGCVPKPAVSRRDNPWPALLRGPTWMCHWQNSIA